MAYRSNSLSKLRSEASLPQQQFQPKARDVLVSWARAREYRDGEAGYLQERAWHLIRTCEIASLQLRGTIGRWRKLSKALPIKGQTKGQTNRASLQDGSRDHLTGTYRREAMRVMRQRESPSGLRSICDRQRSNP